MVDNETLHVGDKAVRGHWGVTGCLMSFFGKAVQITISHPDSEKPTTIWVNTNSLANKIAALVDKKEISAEPKTPEKIDELIANIFLKQTLTFQSNTNSNDPVVFGSTDLQQNHSNRLDILKKLAGSEHPAVRESAIRNIQGLIGEEDLSPDVRKKAVAALSEAFTALKDIALTSKEEKVVNAASESLIKLAESSDDNISSKAFTALKDIALTSKEEKVVNAASKSLAKLAESSNANVSSKAFTALKDIILTHDKDTAIRSALNSLVRLIDGRKEGQSKKVFQTLREIVLESKNHLLAGQSALHAMLAKFKFYSENAGQPSLRGWLLEEINKISRDPRSPLQFARKGLQEEKDETYYGKIERGELTLPDSSASTLAAAAAPPAAGVSRAAAANNAASAAPAAVAGGAAQSAAAPTQLQPQPPPPPEPAAVVNRAAVANNAANAAPAAVAEEAAVSAASSAPAAPVARRPTIQERKSWRKTLLEFMKKPIGPGALIEGEEIPSPEVLHGGPPPKPEIRLEERTIGGEKGYVLVFDSPQGGSNHTQIMLDGAEQKLAEIINERPGNIHGYIATSGPEESSMAGWLRVIGIQTAPISAHFWGPVSEQASPPAGGAAQSTAAPEPAAGVSRAAVANNAANATPAEVAGGAAQSAAAPGAAALANDPVGVDVAETAAPSQVDPARVKSIQDLLMVPPLQLPTRSGGLAKCSGSVDYNPRSNTNREEIGSGVLFPKPYNPSNEVVGSYNHIREDYVKDREGSVVVFDWPGITKEKLQQIMPGVVEELARLGKNYIGWVVADGQRTAPIEAWQKSRNPFENPEQ